MEKLTQKEAIKQYMLTNPNGITSIEAIYKFGATRLSDIIYKLKREGLNIATEYETVTTRNGNKTSVARYKVKE